MKIINSLGQQEDFDPSKVSVKIKALSEPYPSIDPDIVIKGTIASIAEGMTTSAIDSLSSSVAESYGRYHPDYLMLAGNILASRLQQDNHSFESSMDKLYQAGYLTRSFMYKVLHYSSIANANTDGEKGLDLYIFSDRDYLYDVMGMGTLIGNKQTGMRLWKVEGKTVETPQYALLRVAIANSDSLEEALDIYDECSLLNLSLPSPVWFNSGSPYGSMISCNLVTALTDDPDSIRGILATDAQCAILSSGAAGLGIDMTPIRSSETPMRSGGLAAGVVKDIRTKQSLAEQFNQSGKRSGSWAMYLEPWHRDIFAFLKAGRPHTAESIRAQEVFYGQWMNDLFMEKLIEGDDDWYLFCPHDLMKIGIDLHDAWGEEFKVLYNQAVEAGIGKLVSLSSLASEIAVSVIESGKYYMLFKDEINSKSMHSHMGTIKSSNLCTEVVQYTDTYTVANCVLISLVLPNFIDEQGSILLNKMRKSVKIGVGMLNHIIDNNNFLTPESEKGAIEQRALGIGVAGLADCYTSLGYPFQSDEANELNKGLFQSLYLSALEASCSMAREKGLPSGMRWEASKYSKGLLHCDQYIDDERGTFTEEDAKAFDEVRKDIMEYGLYNTLFIAPMPTASSSNVAGVIESFEPIKSLLYTREIDGVKYTIINKQFVKDCEGLDIWSKALSDDLLRNGGILEGVDLAKYLSANPMVDDRERVNIESKLRKIYKTAYEKGMNRSIQIQARDRLPYVDQSQSMNLFTTSTSESTYWSMMVAGWKMGLKTGCYYLRSQSKGKADQGLVLQEGSACGIGGCEV